MELAKALGRPSEVVNMLIDSEQPKETAELLQESKTQKTPLAIMPVQKLPNQ